MGPVVVVVAAVIGKEPLQVALIDGDDMVQQVAPTALKLNPTSTFVQDGDSMAAIELS